MEVEPLGAARRARDVLGGPLLRRVWILAGTSGVLIGVVRPSTNLSLVRASLSQCFFATAGAVSFGFLVAGCDEDEAAWEAKHPLLQALSLTVAAACTSRAAFKAVQHLVFNGCMDTYLSPTRIRFKLDAVVQKRTRYMEASNASLEYELRGWQADIAHLVVA